ncbi:hypothetical protein Scep_017999 [Stephania cephalantha]|uniref:NET domain-containing protein n=1 Tax=Stephania cephalantha TaxID=152367 RepID=A0AAP0NXG5_9MAGN
MPEASKASPYQTEPNEVGPDCFGYYIREIQELLALKKDFLSPLCTGNPASSGTCAKFEVNAINVDCKNSSSLFSNCLGDKLSDLERERLKASLKQSVTDLSREVDEMVDPIFSMCRVKALLRNKEHLTNNANTNGRDVSESSSKKQRMSSSLSSTSISTEAEAHASEYVKEDLLDEDLRILQETDEAETQEIMKKYSDELLAKLECMEQKLEELLDLVMSACRQMTLQEKQDLRKRVQNLPPKNLDRVVEIIQRKKLPKLQSCDEMHIDLEEEDNVTLWRVYFYAEAVTNAKKLSSSLKASGRE